MHWEYVRYGYVHLSAMKFVVTKKTPTGVIKSKADNLIRVAYFCERYTDGFTPFPLQNIFFYFYGGQC